MKLYDLAIRDHLLDLNFTRGHSQAIREIVIHHNAAHGVDPYDTWQTREASAHFQVWGTGQIDNLVLLSDTAWHAHEANDYSIGVEHENSAIGGNWPIADATLHASAKLIGYLCAYFSLGPPALGKNVTYHQAIEMDGVGVDSGTACPGPYFIGVLRNKGHWYWTEAVAAYNHIKGISTPLPGPKPVPVVMKEDDEMIKLTIATNATTKKQTGYVTTQGGVTERHAHEVAQMGKMLGITVIQVDDKVTQEALPGLREALNQVVETKSV